MAGEQGIDYAGPANSVVSVVAAAHVREDDTQQAVGERIVRIEFDRPPQNGLGPGPVPIEPEFQETGRGLAFGEIGVGADGVLGSFTREWPDLERGCRR